MFESSLALALSIKSSFPLVFELAKIGGALGGAYLGFRKIYRARNLPLEAELKGLSATHQALKDEIDKLNAETLAFHKQTASIKAETAGFAARTAEAVLERAQREREQGNHEIAARILADWHSAESPAVGEIAHRLAVLGEARHQDSVGDYDLKMQVDRLQALAELTAAEVNRRPGGTHV